MAFKKWADMTPEEQAAKKRAMADGRARAQAAKAEKRTAAPAPPPAAAPAESIAVKSIAVPGILVDDQGNTWTLPSDSLGDDMELHKSIFRVPNPDPRFYYQFEREADAPGMMTDPSFPMVPVTLKEQGLDKFHASSEYGLQKDSYFRINDSVCMKIPKEFEQRRRRAEKRMVDASVAEVARSSKVKADSADHQSQVELVRGDTMVRRPVQQGA